MNVNYVTMVLPLAQEAATQQVEKTAQPGGPATKAASTQPDTPWWAGPYMPLLLILVMAWLFIFRPKNKQEKKRVQMLSSLKKGDRIQTIGGILGTVVESRDDEVIVKVDETSNTKITFSRSAIHRVREEEKK